MQTSVFAWTLLLCSHVTLPKVDQCWHLAFPTEAESSETGVKDWLS